MDRAHSHHERIAAQELFEAAVYLNKHGHKHAALRMLVAALCVDGAGVRARNCLRWAELLADLADTVLSKGGDNTEYKTANAIIAEIRGLFVPHSLNQ